MLRILNILKKKLLRYQFLKSDPKRKNMGIDTFYGMYGFSVGRYTYGYEQFFYNGVNLENIGSFCSIAPNVTITGMNHPSKFITTNPIIYYKSRGFVDKDRLDIIDKNKNKKVIIGNDVWIGTNVTILPSVTIGNGVIVAAGSVLTKDVPDYAIVAGVPAKVIKYRFSESEIELLNRSKWWEWPDEKIRKNIDIFTKNDAFLKLVSESIYD